MQRLKPPGGFVVPRVQEFNSLGEIIACWRYGMMPKKGTFSAYTIISLHVLNTANKRKEIWPGAIDSSWKAAGHKAAYARIRRIVEKVSTYAERPIDINANEMDTTWDVVWRKAVTNCELALEGKCIPLLTRKDLARNS